MKIGSKVICIDGGTRISVGKVYTIQAICLGGFIRVTDGNEYYSPNRFELVA